jgi:hypothetical protein
MNASSISEKEAEEWLSNFPRLFDLYQRSEKKNPKNYFNFEELFPIAFLGSGAYADIEKVLARLDSAAWEKLRKKALPYVTANDPLRSYQQLFSTLNEARGYVFLADQGYERIEFIEPRPHKTDKPESPDLVARKSESTAILEVKTINESDDCLKPSAPWRHGAVMVPPSLSEKFEDKIDSTIQKARSQLNSYPLRTDRKIVLLVSHFDHGQKTGEHLYLELERFIASRNMKDGIEVYHQAIL